VEDEVMGSRPIECMSNLTIKKEMYLFPFYVRIPVSMRLEYHP
jgi:hypothetical protein